MARNSLSGDEGVDAGSAHLDFDLLIGICGNGTAEHRLVARAGCGRCDRERCEDKFLHCIVSVFMSGIAKINKSADYAYPLRGG